MALKKYSVAIRGHSTSFSLEDEFMTALKSIAKSKQISMAQLVTQIDVTRQEDQNLSSAIRVYVLKEVSKH